MRDIGGNLRRWARESIVHLDLPLLTIALTIFGVGLLTVNSATYDTQTKFFAQLISGGVALAIMWVASRIPPQKLMRIAVPIYVIGIVLLLSLIHI